MQGWSIKIRGGILQQARLAVIRKSSLFRDSFYALCGVQIPALLRDRLLAYYAIFLSNEECESGTELMIVD